MSTELRNLFNELVADQPQHGIDLDERIRRGRRHNRVRNVATAGLATVVTAGVIGAGFTFRPDANGSEGVAGTGRPSGGPSTVCQTYPEADAVGCTFYPGTGVVSDPSTKQSKALARQLDSLVREHAGVTGYTRFDGQRQWSDGGKVDVLEAGYRVGVTDPGTDDPRRTAYLRNGLYAFRVEVTSRAAKLSQPFCIDMYLPKPKCVGEPRQLADGSTATVHHQQVAGKTRYAVRVIRPDGTGILIESGITLNDDATTVVDVPAIGPERLLEIAQAITVTP